MYDTWKIQLMIAINFMSSKENDKEYAMHSKSYKIEIKINDKSDEVQKNVFSHFSVGIKLGLKYQ